MNQRIKELAEQAGWMMSDEVDGFNNRLERFTELIVLECVGLAKLAQLSNTSMDVIKEHFGVE